MGANGDEQGFDVKENRLERPTGWMKITRFETVRFIIDALIESPPNYEFNKSELSRRTGMSREAIRDHLPLLIELGIVEEDADQGWAEYSLNEESRITKEILHLNNAINAVEAGQSKNVESAEYEVTGRQVSFVDAPNIQGAIVQPYSMKKYSEKSTVAESERVGNTWDSIPNENRRPV